MPSGTVTFNGANGGVRLLYDESCSQTSQKSTITITDIQVRSTAIPSAASFILTFYIYLGDKTFTVSGYDTLRTIQPNTWTSMLQPSGFSASVNNDGKSSQTTTVRLAGGYESGVVGSSYPQYDQYNISPYSMTQTISLTNYLYNTASTITATSPVTLGSNCTITIRSQYASYAHLIQYSLNNSSWTDIQTITDNATSGKSITWSTNVNAIKNAMSSSSQITCYLRCRTYTSSAKTTLVGDTTTSITIKASSAPTVSLTVSANNSDNSTVNGWGLYVQGYTKINISTTCTPSIGASVARCQIYIGNALVSDTNGTNTTVTYNSSSAVTESGSIKVTATFTDSRGVSGTATQTITVYAYSQPYASSISAIRYSTNVNTENEDGTNISAKATIGYSSVNGRNSSHGVYVRYRASNSSTWSSNVSLTSGAANYAKINGNTTLSNTTSYIVQFLVYDSLHPVGTNPITYEVVIPTKSVVIHSRNGGGGVALGGYNNANAIQLWLDTYLYGKMVLPNSMYGTGDPPSSGNVVGQVYFKLID